MSEKQNGLFFAIRAELIENLEHFVSDTCFHITLGPGPNPLMAHIFISAFIYRHFI